MGRLACVSGYRNPDFRTLPELPHVPFLGRYEKNALVRGPMPPPLSHRLVFGELVCFPNDKDVTGGLSAHQTLRVQITGLKKFRSHGVTDVPSLSLCIVVCCF